MKQLTVTGLPPRQAEALLCTASGMTHKQAAKKMGCSPQNVTMLMDSVRFKLHAKTAAEAVSNAWQRGLLRLLALVMTVSSVTAFLPAPAAQASDDDPLVRRIRTRPSGRGARRIRTNDQLCDLFDDPQHLDYALFHRIQPVLVWDDGLYLTFQ